MDTNELLKQYAQRIDEATNEVAEDLRTLRADLQAQSVNPDTVAKLEGAIARLETTGKDPVTEVEG